MSVRFWCSHNGEENSQEEGGSWVGTANKREKKKKELLFILALIFSSSSLPQPVYLTRVAKSLIHHSLICFYEPA